MKRPDLTATVDGKIIASEIQRQLFDDIRHGYCVRCQAKDHARASCKQPAGKWEEKFDKDKGGYWTSTLKWQQKAHAKKTTVKSTTPTKVTFPPSLVHKDSHRQTLAPSSSDDDDEDLSLQWRFQHLTDPPDPGEDSEDEIPPFLSSDVVDYYHYLIIVHPPDSDDSATKKLTPEELVEAIMESTCMNTIDCYGPSAFALAQAPP